jgi:hypothetical protein
MKTRIALTLAALTLLGVACTTEPDTLGVKSFDGATTDETTPATTPEPVEAPSTCDVAREALLTGTPADITTAMLALKADTTADATAREYADYYTGRDKGNAQMQEMDMSLIRMSCSI